MVRTISTEYVDRHTCTGEQYNELIILGRPYSEQLERKRNRIRNKQIMSEQEYLSIGPCPYEETPAQVGSVTYAKQSKKEATQFIRMLYGLLSDQFGPDNVAIAIRNKGFPHDFGTYHEVCAFYNPDNQKSVEQAFWLESNTPAEWDEEARKALGL